MSYQISDLEIDRIFLDTENPRFQKGPDYSERDVIKLLCEHEYVIALAKDIVEIGFTNPLELPGVIIDEKSVSDLEEKTYIVLEGNRRICALKLLRDPELAPSKYKKEFEKLSKKWNKIDTETCIIFEQRSDAKIWLQRLHGDLDGGVGRKKWTAEQKQRFNENSRNAIAQNILDYAQNIGLLNDEQRKAKLTTAQRFLGNPDVRKVLGVISKNNHLFINWPKEDFEARLSQFITDLTEGELIHSRAKKDDFVAYAEHLENNTPVVGCQIEPIPINEITTAPTIPLKTKKNTRPKKAPKVRKIQYSQEISNLLKESGNQKLQNIYYGICKIDLEDYFVPILTISCWAFIECLSAAAGRNDTTSFQSFYSKNMLASYQINNDVKVFHQALERLEKNGNATKHHFISANFNGEQLANDMETLKPVILATLNKIIAKNTSS